VKYSSAINGTSPTVKALGKYTVQPEWSIGQTDACSDALEVETRIRAPVAVSIGPTPGMNRREIDHASTAMIHAPRHIETGPLAQSLDDVSDPENSGTKTSGARA
jgi:hypothetical protein